MGDYTLVSPDKLLEISLRYLGEAPHGDSYHEMTIEGVRLPGLFWGSNFAFTADASLLAASWMAELYDRETIIIEIARRRFCALPDYLYNFNFDGLRLVGVGTSKDVSYDVAGRRGWITF